LVLAPLFGILLGDSLNEKLGAWLLITSVLVFGLPHGACDFWILQETSKLHRISFRKLIIYFSIYLMLAILTVGVWFVAPGFALTGFLLLTVWHFGSGDAIWAKTDNLQWILSSAGRGLLVIFSPIAFHREMSGNVLYGLTVNSETALVEIILSLSPLLVIIGFILLVTESLVNYRYSESSAERIKWTEIGLLLIMFWFTTPLLAITLYLIGVHSWRHILRLDLYEKDQKAFRNCPKTLGQIILGFHRKALPMTFLSLIGLFGIIWFFQIRSNDIFQMSYAYLILLSALTVPHATLISWMETRNKSVNKFQTAEIYSG
jgi:Brp/Blh family beta-carotene 15,15'-monooxygenase